MILYFFFYTLERLGGAFVAVGFLGRVGLASLTAAGMISATLTGAAEFSALLIVVASAMP